MNRIKKLFSTGKNNILSVYFTAGYPLAGDTNLIINELCDAGVDMIEIGMPFSDPVADGTVIQRSSEKALLNGMSIKMLFSQLEHVWEVSDLPLILMGYFNPVHRFGVGNFLRKCRDCGIDGTIIPDLPAEEYISSYKSMFEKYGIINIFLVTAQTPVERVRYLDSLSKGFLYLVSSASTTGSINNIESDQISYFEKIRALELTSPVMIGFGISNRETFGAACKHASGAIIGSAFISALDGEGTLKEKISGFIRNIKE